MSDVPPAVTPTLDSCSIHAWQPIDVLSAGQPLIARLPYQGGALPRSFQVSTEACSTCGSVRMFLLHPTAFEQEIVSLTSTQRDHLTHERKI